MPDTTGSVLVVNCGSSSLKYELVDPGTGRRAARGQVERIGRPGALLRHQPAGGGADVDRSAPGLDHEGALRLVLEVLAGDGLDLGSAPSGVAAVGHRVVMGGERFDRPVLVDDEVVAAVEALSPLAPLHNPANLAGIRVARELLPGVPQVAVFDTAFFRHLPAPARTYALDREVAAANAIRRYGFHGTSHRHVSEAVVELVAPADRASFRQIVLHLGNGASASAVVGGRAVDTSMGMTPLPGLVMGTRSGDLDPAVVLHLLRAGAMTVDDVDDLLNRRSGLLGLAGRSDMREVRGLADRGDAAARLALDVHLHRLRHYIGAYAAVMGGLDALTFTAGIGEHDAALRAEAVDGLEFLGISIDPAANAEPSDRARIISPEGGPVSVLVVPTDEELAIARPALAVVTGRSGPG